MLHFLPAWYRENQWCENEQCWQERRMHTEFDDTVKHVQLFHRHHPYPYCIMLLSYAPNLRHFLHRQGVYNAPYWSCFDAVQEVLRKKATVLSYHNLSWPDDTEFLHTPFSVVAFRKDCKYAQVFFGEDGNMIRVEMYSNDKVQRQNIYDDRGFISSTILYKDGYPYNQDYLTQEGKWKIRHFFMDGHVEVNPNNPWYLTVHENSEVFGKKFFTKLNYNSMQEIIGEVTESYVLQTSPEDIFCIATHERHLDLLNQILTGRRRTILSFFEDRCEIGGSPVVQMFLEKTDYIVTDSRETSEQICEYNNNLRRKVKDIPPYDTRTDMGISQQLSIQKIMVPVDGLSDDWFVKLITMFGKYVTKNNYARIHLFTRKADLSYTNQMIERVKVCLRENGLNEEIADQMNNNVTEEESQVRFYVDQCVDELSVSRCMREQRVIVDMRDVTDLYLRISAISMGIPQIVLRQTQFVEEDGNGMIVKNPAELLEALDYYLDGLANWNKAVIASYELSRKFSTRVLIDKWKEVLESIG